MSQVWQGVRRQDVRDYEGRKMLHDASETAKMRRMT